MLVFFRVVVVRLESLFFRGSGELGMLVFFRVVVS